MRKRTVKRSRNCHSKRYPSMKSWTPSVGNRSSGRRNTA